MDQDAETSKIAEVARHTVRRRTPVRMPAMRCPVCGELAFLRTSTEASPLTRLLQYICLEAECAYSWEATLSHQRTLSPSGRSPNFRPAQFRDGKPPGHDYGQMPLMDGIDVASGPPTKLAG